MIAKTIMKNIFAVRIFVPPFFDDRSSVESSLS
jgi:hypothetical protein